YRQAKAQLFWNLSRSFRKPGVPKTAVLNQDDSSYDLLRPIPADRRVTYGLSPGVDVTATGIAYGPDATRFTLHTPDGRAEVTTALVGAYNVSNILAAAAAAWALGVSPEVIAAGVARVRGVPGRMERVDEGQDFLALVDFAHTPNALAQALRTARQMASGRVIVVFGCAGLRDREKRTLMGRIAGELADVVILTAEDPRTEDLGAILETIASAARRLGKWEGVDLFRLPDRGRPSCGLARWPARRCGPPAGRGTVHVLRDRGISLGRPGGHAAGPSRPDAGYPPNVPWQGPVPLTRGGYAQ
ncbi:MAG: cyanophycin synthetase, partial [Anaerolineae bacterium]|nr:cyanophycin synthetase [Anaerolineae bacterium]